MLRKIITIDQEKCNGCGLCAQACHEQAIGMVDGKACLLYTSWKACVITAEPSRAQAIRRCLAG